MDDLGRVAEAFSPAPGRPRPEDCECVANPGYTAWPSLKQNGISFQVNSEIDL